MPNTANHFDGSPDAVFGNGRPQLLLRAGDIHLWVAVVADVPVTALAAYFEQVLSSDEREKHARFLFVKDRHRYLVTRALVRYALSRYVPILPVDWRFEASAFGRPLIVNSHPAVSDLTFNISHSDQVVVLGVTRGCRIGVDVEVLHRSVPLDIAGSVFTASEVRQLQSLPSTLQPQRFLDFWTLKESYIKANGKGLSLPLHQFGFDLSGERTLHASFDASLNDAPANWTFWQWRPALDSLGALCVENHPGVDRRVTVRRTVPFVDEKDEAFDVLRRSA